MNILVNTPLISESRESTDDNRICVSGKPLPLVTWSIPK